MSDIRKIDFDNNQVIGRSGKVYKIHQSMSAGRYAQFQMLEKEMAYGFTVKGIFDKLQKCYDLINKMKFADAARSVFDLMTGATKVMERKPTIMKICSLYINSDDEDLGTISDVLMNDKIADWDDIEVMDFFTLAMNAVHGFTELYQTVTRTIMEMPVMDVNE